MLQKICKVSLTLLVPIFALTGCNSLTLDEALKNVDKSKVAIFKDVNYKDAQKHSSSVRFAQAHGGPDHKTIYASTFSQFIVLPPGNYVLQANCATEKGNAYISMSVVAVAGKTVSVECGLVPENDLKGYLKIIELKDTE